jgi:hypothetical protein
MKKLTLTLFTITALLIGSIASVFAEGKEITIAGKGCCAKCMLKEGTECQNVVTVEKDGKKTTYYLVENPTSKEFHKNICKEVKNVTVTGSCKKVDGKLQVTASKIGLTQ